MVFLTTIADLRTNSKNCGQGYARLGYDSWIRHGILILESDQHQILDGHSCTIQHASNRPLLEDLKFYHVGIFLSRLNEKVSVPTSVVYMTVTTLAGQLADEVYNRSLQGTSLVNSYLCHTLYYLLRVFQLKYCFVPNFAYLSQEA